jgi:pyridoxamine 5'-phosphate oxidase
VTLAGDERNEENDAHEPRRRMMLTREQLGDDPLHALTAWLADARAAQPGHELTFTLATVDETGAPDARLVVIRASDERGLTFYNDTRSPKGRQLAAEPRAALVAYWPALSRQVRVRGTVSVLSAEENDAAFSTRERRSRIGYWSNEQSVAIADRAALDRQLDDTIARFDGQDVPRPEHWAVYRLAPESIEFWQSGERHLHDRICYTLMGGAWRAERLQP